MPLLVAADDAARVLTAAEDVMGFARQQVEVMRAANYDHTETLDSEVTRLNATSVLYRADFARQRANESEIGRLEVTYLIHRRTGGSADLRASPSHAVTIAAPRDSTATSQAAPSRALP